MVVNDEKIMKIRILSVDCLKGASGIEFHSFYGAMSFVDYDVLIIDPEHIPYRWLLDTAFLKRYPNNTIWAYADYDNGLSYELKGSMARRDRETRLLLMKTAGIVLCFLRNRGELLYCAQNTNSAKNYSTLHRYSWLPVRNIVNDFEKREGKLVGEVTKTHPFRQYFLALQDELRYEVIINTENAIEGLKTIARNKVGEVIAFELPFGPGRFIFLPPPSSKSADKKIAAVLIDCIRKSLEWSIPIDKPVWMKQYGLPGEENMQVELKKIDEELRYVDEKRATVQRKIDESELVKGLLYESGKYGLEPPVRKAFRILGFHVLEPEKYQEDYDLFIKEGNLLIIGEIEGAEKQVDVQKYRQLLDYVTDATLKGEKCKGILIGNGYKNMEPSQRSEQFTEHAIRGCESQKYCRIATPELYKAVKTILANPDNEEIKKTIKKKILSCESEFKLSSLQLPVNDKR